MKQTKNQIRERLQGAFPKALALDVQKVADSVIDNQFELHQSLNQEVILNGERLVIPARLYADESPTIAGLTDIQRTILHCLYLRHHNGFVRQAHLEKLLHNTDYFVIPFVFQLFGEYVVEILSVANAHINAQTIALYQKFIAENPTYAKQTESRMTSYWDAYYRSQTPDLKHYIGREIFKKLKQPLRS